MDLQTSLLTSNYLGNTNTPDDIFLQQLYYYYYKKGSKNIITESVIYLFINAFLLFFTNLLTNCIDYHSLIHLDTRHNFGDFININNWFPSNSYLFICNIIYFIYLFCLLISTYNEIKLSIKLKNVYKEKLGITHKNINYLRWEEIQKKIINHYADPNLNEFTINSKIMRRENIITSVFRKDMFNYWYISQFIEWNFVYCFINSLFNKDNIITDETIYNYREKVRTRLKLILIINILALPFAIYIILIYSIIKYGETFYHHPELISKRGFTIKSTLRMRFYNELTHEYYQRKKSLGNIIKQRLDRHPITIISIILRLCIFIMGSFFLLILILTIINENMLTECFIFDKSMLWVLSIVGTLIIISRKNTVSYEKASNQFENNVDKDINENNKLEELFGSISPDLFTQENYKKSFKFLNNIYQYKLGFIMFELFYIIISPYYIIKWINDSYNISTIVLGELDNHYILGYVSMDSQLTNEILINENPHTFSSFINFINNNPEWMYLQTKNITTNNMVFNWDLYKEYVSKSVSENLNNQSLKSVYLIDDNYP
jgi:hypothetical protein